MPFTQKDLTVIFKCVCVLQCIHIHNEVRQYDSTWQHYTQHLTETGVRSYNLFKQDRKIQMHKTELATMELYYLHLDFCKTGFILTTELQTSRYLVALNFSVSSDFNCEQSFSKEAWPISKHCLSLAAACWNNIRQGRINFRTRC